jgi:Vitamin K-dependent gamma-carboxylase
MTLERLIAAWNRFWFAPQSPLPISLYRILLGMLLLTFGLLLAPDWLIWFSEKGMLTRDTASLFQAEFPAIDLFQVLPPGDGSAMLVFYLFMVSSLCLTLGLFTRTSAVLVFLCLASLDGRNPFIFHGGDVFLRLSIFFLIFSQAGAALSLDRLWRLKRGVQCGPPPASAPWAQRLIQLQLAAVYLTNAIVKSSGEVWLDGTAIYYTARIEEFWRLPVPYVFDHMWTIKFATWSTILIEAALGLAIWFKDLRYLVLLAGLMLHAGIEWAMNIPLFAATMVAAYVTFIEPAHLSLVLDWLKRLRPPRGIGLQNPTSTSSTSYQEPGA